MQGRAVKKAEAEEEAARKLVESLKREGKWDQTNASNPPQRGSAMVRTLTFY